tara:strand:- start:63206 stop:63544 length:339 start_codon:yes stop_codon:yes gene_type:complete
MSITTVKEVNYVCESPSISIKVKYDSMYGSATTHFYIDNKEATSFTYKLPFPNNKEDYDAFLKNVCDLLFNSLEIDEFINYLSDDEYLKGQYIYKALKMVRSKGGKIIWRKN